MTLVLDSGGVTALAGSRARLAALLEKEAWPPVVPVVVLAECLTGDRRRDVVTDRLLRLCRVSEVDEPTVREAARLRTATGRSGRISAVDAIVAAVAAAERDPVVLTCDPRDLGALAAHTTHPVDVVGV